MRRRPAGATLSLPITSQERAMRALIVYESMYGNTHAIADGIAEGLRDVAEVQVASVHEATAGLVAAVDLLVVGGPTHVHGLSRPSTRDAALKDAELPADPDAEGPGVREWLDGLPDVAGVAAAAFDTRIDGPAILTGRASRGIHKRLRGRGFDTVAEPESFLVDRKGHLHDGERERARAWGASLAGRLAAARS
jgi:flavodoxin